MDPKNMSALIAGTVVCIVVFSALLIPIVSEATTTEKTFQNEGYYYMTDTTTEHTYVFDGTKWTIDGEVLNHTLAGINIIATDTFFIRDVGQVRGAYNISGITACNLTVSDGQITGTYTADSDPVSVTWTFSTFYGATTEKAGYIMSKSTLTPIAYLKGDSDVFGYGQTNLGGSQTTFQITGNKDDGLTVTCPNTSVTISNLSYNLTPVQGYKDLYTFTSVTFTATLSGTDYPVTYNIIVLPAEVTAELTVHPDAATLALISMLPIIAMIGIILAVVGAFVVSRNDY